jgi:hypothetical protein
LARCRSGGKLGVTVIANSRDEVNYLYRRTLEILDREASLGHGESTATTVAGHG